MKTKQRVREASSVWEGDEGVGWHDILFIIRGGPSHLREGSRRGAAPGGGARSYYVRSRAKKKKRGLNNGHIFKFNIQANEKGKSVRLNKNMFGYFRA